MLFDGIQYLIDGMGFLVTSVLGLLPQSPFSAVNMIMLDNQILAHISWLLPIAEIILLLQAWIVAVGLFYLSKIVLRWGKVTV